jgi:hypothetical protein
MAGAVLSGTYDLIVLGRTAVLDPDISKRLLFNPELGDDDALARPHIVK